MSARVSAGFDALFVADALAQFADGAAAVELHLFSYLACMVSLYDGEQPDDWRYSFVATPAGAPFAEVMAEETDRLRAAGRLLDNGPLLVPSALGLDELAMFRKFATTRDRERYLEAACSAASMVPLPTLAHSIMQEPGLRNALSADASRELLSDAQLILVDQQFAAVSETLSARKHEHRDLLVPTTLWLSYLDASTRQVA